VDAPEATPLELIGAIYDAVIDPGRWNDAVDRIRRHLGFANCMLTATAIPSGSLIVGAQGGVPSPYSETVYRYGNDALDQWGGLERIETLPKEEPLVFSEHNSLADLAGNPFYEDWSKPQGLVDLIVLVLEYSSRMIAVAAFGVHASAPPLSDGQIEGLRVLAPHLRRAVIISGLLEGRARAAASFEAALSALGSAVVLVDDEMRVVYANAPAEDMLRAGDPMARLNERLDLPGELVPGQLRAAVEAAAADASGLVRGGGIPVRRRDGSGMIVHVLPLGRRQMPARETAMGRAVAAIFVSEPNAELNLPMEAMQLLYGLRPAEARVFELIVRGLSAPKIAEGLGIAPSTVKTHTLRLFDKLGVHSRAELLRFARDASLGPQ
jgi:DNA-binding CsgD family transcriptional regulator